METNIEQLIKEVVPEFSEVRPQKTREVWTTYMEVDSSIPIPWPARAVVTSIIVFISWAERAVLWSESFFITPKPKSLPSFLEVQTRLLDRMKSEIEKAKKDIIGEGSTFENRIAELKKKRSEADVLRQYFYIRTQQCSDAEKATFEGLKNEAIETRDLLDAELEGLDKEQQAVLTLFAEVETFIPAEELRLCDDLNIAKLRELRGAATAAREVSREMLMQVVAPTLEKLFVLNAARERLLSHSLAASQPVSLERFIDQAEQGAESVVRMDTMLRQIGSNVERQEGLVN